MLGTSAVDAVGVPAFVTQVINDPVEGMTLTTRWGGRGGRGGEDSRGLRDTGHEQPRGGPCLRDAVGVPACRGHDATSSQVRGASDVEGMTPRPLFLLLPPSTVPPSHLLSRSKNMWTSNPGYIVRDGPRMASTTHRDFVYDQEEVCVCSFGGGGGVFWAGGEG